MTIFQSISERTAVMGLLPLAGIKVLVTRPAQQAAGLSARITAAGGEVVLLPVIEIAEISENRELAECAAELEHFAMLLFVSANAVEKSLPFVLAERPLPPAIQIGAVGRATAEALRHYGYSPQLLPEHSFNSEGLLALPALQAEKVQGRQIAIFRGDGGRELLSETLRARGAIVRQVSVYQRRCPSPRPLSQEAADVIVITSGEALHNLIAMLNAPTWLWSKPLIVLSKRLAELARKQTFQRLWIAPEMSDNGLFIAILHWRESGCVAPIYSENL